MTEHSTKRPKMVMEAKRWPGSGHVDQDPRGKNLEQRAADLQARAGVAAASQGPSHATWRVVAKGYPPVPLQTRSHDRELMLMACAVLGGWVLLTVLFVLPGFVLLQGALN